MVLRDLLIGGTTHFADFAAELDTESLALGLESIRDASKRAETISGVLDTIRQLAKDAQVEMTHIPYRGGAPAMVDVIGGNLPTLFTTLPNLLQQYKGGKLRILGFSGDKRMAALPEIPTFKEQGFPNLTMSEMFVFMAKAQTPPALQKELASALSAAVRSKDVILALEKAEFEPLVMEQAAISKRLQEETAHWAAVVRSTGYKAED